MIVEAIYIAIYIFCHTILFLSILSTGNIGGEFIGISCKLDNLEVISIFAMTICTYLIVFLLYKYSTKSYKGIKSYIRFKININKFDYFFLILLLAHSVFYIKTGVGKSLGGGTSSFSFIFSLLNMDSLFGIYFFTCVRKNKIFCFNVVGYVLLQTIKGWSGILLTVTFFVFYICRKKYKKKFSTLLNLLIMMMVPSIILFGGFLYQFIYPVKIYIRMGFKNFISYSEALNALVSRLSFFPSSLIAFQEISLMKEVHFQEYIPFREIQSMFRPLLPRQIMPYKEFRPFTNIIKKAIWDDFGMETTTNYGLTAYAYSLIKIDIKEFITWAVVLVLGILLVRVMICLFEQEKGQLSFLWFIFLIKIIQNPNLEGALTYNEMYLIYMIPILLLIGVVTIMRSEK